MLEYIVYTPNSLTSSKVVSMRNVLILSIIFAIVFITKAEPILIKYEGFGEFHQVSHIWNPESNKHNKKVDATYFSYFSGNIKYTTDGDAYEHWLEWEWDITYTFIDPETKKG